MFHVKHCGGKKEYLSAGTERFHVKHFGNSAKNDEYCRGHGLSAELSWLLLGLRLRQKYKRDAENGKNGRGRVLQVYAAKSNEEKQCNVQRDENGRKTSDEKP